MDVLTVVLILVVGIVIGSLGTAAALRERRSDSSPSAHLVELAGERFERDAARREAQDQARDAALSRTLSPISESLAQVERALARTETLRSESDGMLRRHLGELAERTDRLDAGTNALTAALRAPTARGRWGEVQLRRIVEAAGMLDHVDFDEQHTGRRADGEASQRPDLVVHLTGDRRLVIDAKAPMDAYLDAVEETDPQRAASRRRAHGKALRHHVDKLSAKSYWAGLGDTPEFTVLFVPSDGVLAAALESDPGLLEHGFDQDVVIASPATLVALLRTVAHTWRTDALNRDARTVLEAGRELHRRLGTFTGHLGRTGRSLDAAISAYNDAVGSLQSRVMVTARKFEDMNLVGTRLDEIEQLTERSRSLGEDEIGDLAGGDRRGHRSQGDGSESSRSA